MKKLIYSLFLSLPIMATAQNKPNELANIITPIEIKVPCGPSAIIIDELRKSHNNFPVFVGHAGSKESKTTMTFWIDSKKDKWVVLVTNEEISCVFAYGDDLNFIAPKSTKEM